MRAYDEIDYPADENAADLDSAVDDGPSSDAAERIHARVAQLLIELFNRNLLAYPLALSFESHASLLFAERFHRLLKLKALAASLTDDILPRIHRNISFTPERLKETSRHHPRGAIDVAGTMRTHYTNAAVTVMSDMVSLHPIRNFTTPENILTVVTVNRVMEDIQRILTAQGGNTGLHPEEEQLLTDTIRKLRRALRPAMFARLIPTAGLLTPHEIELLVRRATDRIMRMRGKRNGYHALLAWRRAYESLGATTPGDGYMTDIRRVSPDKGYELLVTLEILVRLSKYGRVRQRRHPSGAPGPRHDPSFECLFRDGARWEIFIQSSSPLRDYKYLDSLTGIPDMIIRNPDNDRLFITDAKQYTETSYGAAFYKMMGYLYQFGYPDAFDRVAGGVLFVPRKIGREAGWTVWRGPERPGDTQALATLTIPPEGVMRQETQYDCDRFIAYAKQALCNDS